MELIGLLFALPVLLIFGFFYWLFINKILNKFLYAKTVILIVSYFILSFALLELSAVSLIDILQFTEKNKNLFFSIHLILFFIVVPSFLNIIIIKFSTLNKWYFIGLLSMFFGFLVLLFHIHISEILFGID